MSSTSLDRVAALAATVAGSCRWDIDISANRGDWDNPWVSIDVWIWPKGAPGIDVEAGGHGLDEACAAAVEKLERLIAGKEKTP